MNWLVKFIRSYVQHFNYDKYWKMRDYAISEGGNKLLKLICLYKVKKMDAYNNASFGTHFCYGAQVGKGICLPHGLNGIIVTHNAIIGENVTIFHQVTIGEGKGGAPIIGDNVLIGAGAKIIGKITIGSNAKIGANCIVVDDVPENATVVMRKPRIITGKGA